MILIEAVLLWWYQISTTLDRFGESILKKPPQASGSSGAWRSFRSFRVSQMLARGQEKGFVRSFWPVIGTSQLIVGIVLHFGL